MTPIYVSSVALVACGMAYTDTRMRMHVEVRGHLLLGFRCHPQIFFETRSLTGLELAQ